MVSPHNRGMFLGRLRPEVISTGRFIDKPPAILTPNAKCPPKVTSSAHQSGKYLTPPSQELTLSCKGGKRVCDSPCLYTNTGWDLVFGCCLGRPKWSRSMQVPRGVSYLRITNYVAILMEFPMIKLPMVQENSKTTSHNTRTRRRS